MNLAQARENMIEQQIRPWDVLDQRVLDVLVEIPRERFVDASHQGIAYSDIQLPIGHDQVMLHPNVDGRILQALSIHTTEKVLEIGTGSGFLTACLARLGGFIDTVEIIPELAESAAQRLQQMGISNVNPRTLDASKEWDAADGYDAIALTGACESIPEYYKHKLKTNGRLFGFVGSLTVPAMEAVLVTRISADEWLIESQFETRVPPLLNFDAPTSSFSF